MENERKNNPMEFILMENDEDAEFSIKQTTAQNYFLLCLCVDRFFFCCSTLLSVYN